MQTDLITKVYFNEHLTHSCVGMPQGLQALLSSYLKYPLKDLHVMKTSPIRLEQENVIYKILLI